MDNMGDAASWAWVGGAGIMGRLMYHAKQVQMGRRTPFGWVLLWELPIALAMGWIALGLATWLRVDWPVTISIALVAAYLGPYTIDTIFIRWAEWWFGRKGK